MMTSNAPTQEAVLMVFSKAFAWVEEVRMMLKKGIDLLKSDNFLSLTFSTSYLLSNARALEKHALYEGNKTSSWVKGEGRRKSTYLVAESKDLHCPFLSIDVLPLHLPHQVTPKLWLLNEKGAIMKHILHEFTPCLLSLKNQEAEVKRQENDEPFLGKPLNPG